jgi:hypothetical protein
LNEEGQTSQPNEEELRRQMEEQIKQLRIDDVILQTVVTLVNLTGRKLTVEGEKDLEQARKGIDAVRVLLPLCPEDQVGPVKEAVSQLQMLFARESQQPDEAAGGEAGEEDVEREKARSKLWTPPGSQ